MKKFSMIVTAATLVASSAVADPVIININAAMQPIGNLQINKKIVSGYITGIDVNAETIAVDSFNRGFVITLGSQEHNFSMFNSTVEEKGAQVNLLQDDASSNLLLSARNLDEWTLSNRVLRSGAFNYDVYLKTRKDHPWMSFAGVYGDMEMNAILDNVFTFSNNGLQAKLGVMATKTWFNKGIVTKVDDQIGTWGEVSFIKNGLSLASGVFPTALSGKIHTTRPSEQDSQTGELSYINESFKPTSKMQQYLRVEYTMDLSKYSQLAFGAYSTNIKDMDSTTSYNVGYTITF